MSQRGVALTRVSGVGLAALFLGRGKVTNVTRKRPKSIVLRPFLPLRDERCNGWDITWASLSETRNRVSERRDHVGPAHGRGGPAKMVAASLLVRDQ
jgi:hypothetical protein